MSKVDAESRALGMVVGAAVGDALGAPFEFYSPGLYRKTFPQPVHTEPYEMIGGGSFDWEPGEFTDDTQMALALAESILDHGDFDADTTWRWFRAWSQTAADIGITTSWSLNHEDWRDVTPHSRSSASNGALMRSFVLAAACHGRADDDVLRIVLAQSALTHPHPASGWGAWIAVETCRAFIAGRDGLESIDALVARIPDSAPFEQMLHPEWKPVPTAVSNGSVWGCLAQAVWAVRSTSSFEEAVVAAVNLGDDADTVGCVTGALAGARYGLEDVPERWRRVVHGRLDGPSGRLEYFVADLERVTQALLDIARR
jgi:ADP-ribosyl-[dinitrogen reductase] hydrolase